MKRMIENITGSYSASASVVDGTLILSLPDALTPVVWRLELGNARASALEVRNHEDGSFVLMLKTPRGDVNDIAAFSSRGRAVAALMTVSRAMEQAHGQIIQPVANDSDPYNPSRLPVPIRGRRSHKKTAKGKNILAGLIAVVLIVILLGALANITPGPVGQLSSTNPASGEQSSAAERTGVPVSADDFLKNR